MSGYQTQSLSQDKFLLVAINLLHRAFVDAPRTEAKKLFRQISEGKLVQLTTVQMEDKSNAPFLLSLDHSEFTGKLNYGAFRASLVTLINNISGHLKEEKTVSVFNAQDSDSAMIFGVSAVTVEEDKPNVMVLSADTAGQGGATTLALMYLDPAQFAGQASPDEAGRAG